MVSHRQRDRADDTATLYDTEQAEDEDSHDGVQTEEVVELEDIPVSYSHGGQGWVQEDSGQRVYRNPSLEWPINQFDVLSEGKELELSRRDEQFVIENIHPRYDRWKQLARVDVEVRAI
ncbi:hypothetical protein [Natrononativus amylolyticus]|uniref:hypothetical protein n=1 Tax=Natrononativus amylolyticus TaxID=2963434 RepID=UPI0020CC77FF|nr:hypothetical protein [Natrononativus amylolyticus]